MNLPLFSLIIANFNSSEFIDDLIDSIKKQTYENIELIFIDDMSVDGSFEKFLNFSKNHNKFKFIIEKNEQNIGGGKTKARAISIATGDIVAFLDCDDYLDSKAIEKMVFAHSSNPKVGLIYSDAFLIDRTGVVLRKLSRSKTIPKESTILDTDSVFHFASWKSEFYKNCRFGFDSKFNIAYDLDLFYKLEEVSELLFIDLPLYYYRIHGSNLSIGFNRIGLCFTELIIAKYEAQLRRGSLSFNKIATELQNSFESERIKTIQSISVKKMICIRFRKYYEKKRKNLFGRLRRNVG